VEGAVFLEGVEVSTSTYIVEAPGMMGGCVEFKAETDLSACVRAREIVEKGVPEWCDKSRLNLFRVPVAADRKCVELIDVPLFRFMWRGMR
jgi:hypothetical protein